MEKETTKGIKMSIGYKEIHDIIFRSSSVEESDGLRIFIERLKPRVVLEIGTYKGLSTAVLASVAEKVCTFDVTYQPLAKEIWRLLEVDRKIEYTIVKDVTEVEPVLKSVRFDFAYMDAEHQYYKFVRQLFNMLSAAGIKRILVDGAEERFPATLRLVEEENMKRLNQDQAYWEEE